MPKIPMYQRQVGTSVGSLSRDASTGAFTQLGDAYATLGSTVSSVAKMAADDFIREKTAEKSRKEAEEKALAAKRKIEAEFNEAQRNAKVEDFKLSQNRALSDAVMTINAPGSGFNTLESRRAEFEKLEQDKYAEIDAIDDFNSDQKKSAKDYVYSTLTQYRASSFRQGLTLELEERSTNFDASAQILLQDVRASTINPEAAVRKYKKDYEEGIRNGLSISLTPEQFEFEIVRGSVGDIVEDESRTVAELELVRAEILDSKGVYAGFEEAQQNQLSGMVSRAIKARTETEGAALQQEAESAALSLTVADSVEEAGEASVTLQQSIDGLNALGADTSELQITADANSNFVAQRNNLIFASDEQVAAVQSANQNMVKSAVNTPDIGVAMATQKLTNDYIAKRAEAIATDPANYVVEQTRQLTGKVPSQSEIYNKLLGMGIADNKITVLTNAQVENFMSEISEAQTPQEIASLSAAMLQSPNSDIRTAVGRQLVNSGFNATLQFIANRPNSPMASLLLASAQSSAVVGAEKPTNAVRAKVLSAVRADPTMSSHIRSMGGEVVAGMTKFEVMAAGVYSPAMEDTATQHVMMVANLAQHLAVTQGNIPLSGSIEPSELEPFIKKAVSVLTERYSYKDINGGSLRMPVSMEAQSESVKQGLQFSILSLDDDQIFFESKDYAIGTPEYDAQKATYISEVKENFRAITQNGDNSALITDKAGGAVLVRSSSPHAMEMYEPLSVGFMDASNIVQRRGRASLKVLNSEIRSLNRQIRSIFGKERRSAEGKAKLKVLESKLKRLESQYKQRQDFLVKIGM